MNDFLLFRRTTPAAKSNQAEVSSAWAALQSLVHAIPEPDGLADYCQQIRTYWEARHAPNVHLFHYADLWADIDGEMRRVAAALEVSIDEDRWPGFVQAAGLSSMRSRAADTAPEAHVGMWVSPERFFRSGGTRDWASMLSPDDISHFEERMRELAGDAADWATGGRVALNGA